jgi:hypothetical protein
MIPEKVDMTVGIQGNDETLTLSIQIRVWTDNDTAVMTVVNSKLGFRLLQRNGQTFLLANLIQTGDDEMSEFWC